MKNNDKILVLGATGMVGSTLVQRLITKEYSNIHTPTRQDLNLLDSKETTQVIQQINPDYIFLCAGKVGGILANIEKPVDFFAINSTIGMNVLQAAHLSKVKKLMNLGSTCIYPRECQQPMKEEYLLTGRVEPTNEGYALSKIGILRLCDYYNKQYGTNFISVMPTNLYGESDDFHPKRSHIMAATIRKVVEAKQNNKQFINVWGTGSAIRELMHTEDACDAMIHIMNNYDGKDGFINIGTGIGTSVKQLTEIVMQIVDYIVPLKFDPSKPDGMPIKVCDISKMKQIGFVPSIDIETGIKRVYDYLKSKNFNWTERL